MKSHGLVSYGWISDNKMQCHLFLKKKKEKRKEKRCNVINKGNKHIQNKTKQIVIPHVKFPYTMSCIYLYLVMILFYFNIRSIERNFLIHYVMYFYCYNKFITCLASHKNKRSWFEQERRGLIFV